MAFFFFLGRFLVSTLPGKAVTPGTGLQHYCPVWDTQAETSGHRGLRTAKCVLEALAPGKKPPSWEAQKAVCAPEREPQMPEAQVESFPKAIIHFKRDERDFGETADPKHACPGLSGNLGAPPEAAIPGRVPPSLGPHTRTGRTCLWAPRARPALTQAAPAGRTGFTAATGQRALRLPRSAAALWVGRPGARGPPWSSSQSPKHAEEPEKRHLVPLESPDCWKSEKA